MDLGEQAHRVTFMIRDRGPDFTAAFDAVPAGAGPRTVLCNVRTPRMNAIAERWIGGCRRELLDRTLAWNQDHLRRILHEYEIHHNPHRPLAAATPLKPLPEPVDLCLTRGDFAKSAAYTVAFAVIGVAGPNVAGENKNTPYLWAREQTGPHDVEPA